MTVLDVSKCSHSVPTHSAKQLHIKLFFVAELLLSTPHYIEGDSVHATPKFVQISKYLL